MGQGMRQGMRPQMIEPYQQINTSNLANGPSCIDVAEHIATCPICSKVYNCDKTLYIVTIIILSIICLLLLKKVLEI